MAGQAYRFSARAPLAGCSVLILEDVWMIAEETSDILRGVGATPVGPVAKPDEALALIERERPCCALLDINLGTGADFAVARALRARDIPFAFLTGYGAYVVPSEFAAAARLEKPARAAAVVATVRALCAQPPA